VEATIGENAGRVWQHLKDQGAQTPAALARALRLKQADVDRGIGWLAREGKLHFESDAKGGLKLSLRGGA
jgi:hypothetical protein